MDTLKLKREKPVATGSTTGLIVGRKKTLIVNSKKDSARPAPEPEAVKAPAPQECTPAPAEAEAPKKKKRKNNPPKPKKAPRPELPTGKVKRTKILTENWPALFDRKNLRPLQVGIFDVLMADVLARGLDISIRQMHLGLVHWTKRPAYIKCISEGGMRYGIDGQPAGEVSEEHQAHAAVKLQPTQEVAS